jgi:hypothetical protein
MYDMDRLKKTTKNHKKILPFLDTDKRANGMPTRYYGTRDGHRIAKKSATSFWNDIEVEIEWVTPKEILLSQSMHLQQLSRGLLLAEVSTAKNEFSEIHALAVIAPTLHNYTHEILEITNERGKPYPATLEYEVLGGEPGNQELTIVAVELASEEDALREIAKALQSPVTRQVIQGLMKRIRPESVVETNDEALSAS